MRSGGGGGGGRPRCCYCGAGLRRAKMAAGQGGGGGGNGGGSSNSGGGSSSNNNGTGGLGIPAHLTLSFSAGPHWGAATLPQPHTVRSLDRALEEAGSSGILCLSGRKLRDFPGSGYDLSDTTQAGGGRGGGRCVGLRWGEGGAERSGAGRRIAAVRGPSPLCYPAVTRGLSVREPAGCGALGVRCPRAVGFVVRSGLCRLLSADGVE